MCSINLHAQILVLFSKMQYIEDQNLLKTLIKFKKLILLKEIDVFRYMLSSLEKM